MNLFIVDFVLELRWRFSLRCDGEVQLGAHLVQNKTESRFSSETKHLDRVGDRKTHYRVYHKNCHRGRLGWFYL
jgi:hypothetical protein